MSYFFGFFLIVLILASIMWMLLAASPARIAGFIRTAGPALLFGTGVILTIVGRGAIGIPLIALGASWWARVRSVGKMNDSRRGGNSTVRSAWLEMELDHQSGEMDGLVLTGSYDGARLSQLDEQDLLKLYEMVCDDHDSAALLEAYFDRRLPGWRENTQPGSGSGQAGSSGSGPMDKEEAYQVLGLRPDASSDEIREAHRRLMKRIHPDSGGSTFLASKINEAKDILLD